MCVCYGWVDGLVRERVGCVCLFLSSECVGVYLECAGLFSEYVGLFSERLRLFSRNETWSDSAGALHLWPGVCACVCVCVVGGWMGEFRPT